MKSIEQEEKIHSTAFTPHKDGAVFILIFMLDQKFYAFRSSASISS